MTKFKVQKRIAAVRGAAKSVGQVWVNVAVGKRQTVAEVIAQRTRIDHDDLVRVVPQREAK